MNIHQQLAIKALERARGDDLYRARLAFRHCTPEEMQYEHGQSGKTRQQILDEYEAHDNAITAAIEWVKEQEAHNGKG